MPPVTLETKRLLLRPLEMDDWPAFHEYMSDSDVLRHMSFLPVAEEVSQNIIRDIVQGRAQEQRVRCLGASASSYARMPG